MKKIILSIFILIKFLTPIQAQTQQLWTKTLGSKGTEFSEKASELATDFLGNVYTIGTFVQATIMGGDTLISAGGLDVYLSKYSSSGTHLWSRRLGGTGDDKANGIAIDGLYLYITGSFFGTANFNTPSATGTNEITSAGDQDIFIAKFNLLGNFIWAKRAGGEYYFDSGKSIAVNDGNIYISGEFSGTANFNTPSSFSTNTILSGGYSDIFIAKYDINGVFQWAKRAGGSSGESNYDLAVNESEIYVVGVFSGTSNFNNPSAPGSNEIVSDGSSQDVFLAKFDVNGIFQWAKRGGGSGTDYAYSIAISGTSVFISGSFIGTANFNNPTLYGSNEIVSSGYQDAFIAKYDNSGALNWVRRMGGPSIFNYNEVVNDIVCKNNNIYGVGVFYGTADFNTPSNPSLNTLPSGNGTDGIDTFFTKFNENGDFQWAKRSGSVDYVDYANAIAIYGNYFYVFNEFNGIINYSNPYSSGYEEFDVGRYNVVLSKFEEKPNSFNSLSSTGSSAVGSEQANAVAVDQNQNTYHIGTFVGTINLGSFSLTSAGGSDIFFIKKNKDGVVQWAKRAGGTGDDAGYGIDYSQTNNIVGITGYFSNSANFNTPSSNGSNELTSAGGTDIFWGSIQAIDGSVISVKRGGGTGNDAGFGISLRNYDGFVTGQFENTANFNTPSSGGSNELISAGGKDILFLVFNLLSGNMTRIRRSGGTGDDIGYGITNDNNDIYLTGVFEGSANFNTPSNAATNAIGSTGGSDIFLAKFSSSGTFSWAKRAGGIDEDAGVSITYYNNDIYLTGNISANADFNTPSASGTNEIISNGLRDIFVAKYSTSGTFAWAKRAGGTDNDLGTGIFVNAFGVYVTGGFRGTINFNNPSASGSNELITAGLRDIFVAKYTHDGNYTWAIRGGGVGDDSNVGICGFNKSIYTAGYFSGTANFNTPSTWGTNELVSSGSQDICFTEIYDDVLQLKSVTTDGIDEFGDVFNGKIASDLNGNVYSLGYYTGTILLNNKIYQVKSQTTNGFILKYDKNGSVLSFNQFYGNYNKPIEISLYNNSIYVTGEFKDTLIINGIDVLTCYSDKTSMFLVKFDINGTFLWAREAGGVADNVYGRSIATNSDGAFVTGDFFGTINFNTPLASGSNELTSAGSSDVFIAKFNHSGILQWIKRAGSTSSEAGNGIVVLGNDAYIIGSFQSVANFNTPNSTGSNEITSAGSRDGFLAKFDNNGVFRWAKRYGGSGDDIGSAIAGKDGYIYITGYFSNTANFNTPSVYGSNELISAGSLDGFISKYDTTGVLQWLRRFGGNGYDYSNDIATDGINIVITGEFEYSSNFNTPSNINSNSITSNGGQDILVANFNSSGTYIWAKHTGNTDTYSNESGNSVALDFSNIYVFGDFSNTVNFSYDDYFSNNITAWGNNDIFLSKLSFCSPTFNLQSPAHDFSGISNSVSANRATGSITATNQITNSSVITYQAKTVTLSPGFKADSGTVFKAQTGGCF